MRKPIQISLTQHSPIVFSTAIPNEVMAAYHTWKSFVDRGSTNKGWAWCKFCDMCEAEGISVKVAIDKITS